MGHTSAGNRLRPRDLQQPRNCFLSTIINPILFMVSHTLIRKYFLFITISLFCIYAWYWHSEPKAEVASQALRPQDGRNHHRLSTSFPKIIWQTGSNAQIARWTNASATWRDNNPEWKYELCTDESATTFVTTHFQHRPSLLKFWSELQNVIVRSDLLRYLALLALGGVYSDIDTSNIKPIDDWIPIHFQRREIDAIIGIEYDDNTYPVFVRPVSFCQWTMMAKPGHPIFESAVRRVVYNLESFARVRRTTVSEIRPTKVEVLELTGPGAFSDAVIEVLRDQMGQDIDWADFQGLTEPTLYGDILVLPINGFGSGQKHSSSDDPYYGEILAKHHFAKSWYTKNGSLDVDIKEEEFKNPIQD